MAEVYPEILSRIADGFRISVQRHSVASSIKGVRFMVCGRLIASVLIGVLAFASAGCTTMQTIRPAMPGEGPFRPLKTGDSLVVLVKGGEQASFVVQRIEGNTLVASDGRRFVLSDLARVERKTFSGGKTAGLIAAIAGGAFLIVAITVGVWLGENSQ
jgi:hypothetical protein